MCPSCNAKRAHVTAGHLVERVLLHVPYRQWTLSFAHRVRWGQGLRGGWRGLVLDDRGLVDGEQHRDRFNGPYAGLGLSS